MSDVLLSSSELRDLDGVASRADEAAVRAALRTEWPGLHELAVLLSPAAGRDLERLAQRAQLLTNHHFGRTISLYVPLYLSNYCSGACVYCGFAADRDVPRRRLTREEQVKELVVLEQAGFEEVLLLTGDRTPEAGFPYLLEAVATAATRFHGVAVEAFGMEEAEYAQLCDAGCIGVTLYQETYDRDCYERLHRGGGKRDYDVRRSAPERALAAGIRAMGMGVLLGLADPVIDLLNLFAHVESIRKSHWTGGLSVSFPRVRPQRGDFAPGCPVSDRLLAQVIMAFRICLPDVPLVLSTRESASFRDGMAGIGISKMSVASRTTVGGYHAQADPSEGQFAVSDNRSLDAFCAMLKQKGLQPVFKNWDSVLHGQIINRS